MGAARGSKASQHHHAQSTDYTAPDRGQGPVCCMHACSTYAHRAVTTAVKQGVLTVRCLNFLHACCLAAYLLQMQAMWAAALHHALVHFCCARTASYQDLCHLRMSKLAMQATTPTLVRETTSPAWSTLAGVLQHMLACRSATHQSMQIGWQDIGNSLLSLS